MSKNKGEVKTEPLKEDEVKTYLIVQEPGTLDKFRKLDITQALLDNNIDPRKVTDDNITGLETSIISKSKDGKEVDKAPSMQYRMYSRNDVMRFSNQLDDIVDVSIVNTKQNAALKSLIVREMNDMLNPRPFTSFGWF